MNQFAYMARTTGGTKSGAPTTWPFGYLYPGDADNTPYPTTPVAAGNIPGVPWPNNWPQAVQANTVVVVEAPATIVWATHSAVIESYITVNASQAAASVYNKHLLQVTVSEGGLVRNLRKSGGAAYVTAIFYQVSNYAGNKYGFSATIDFDNAQWTNLDLIDIQSKLVTAVANPSGTDQWQVLS